MARTAGEEISAGAAGGSWVNWSAEHSMMATPTDRQASRSAVTSMSSRQRHAASEPDHGPRDQRSTLRRQLAYASCERIAVEVRALRRTATVTAVDIDATAGISPTPADRAREDRSQARTTASVWRDPSDTCHRLPRPTGMPVISPCFDLGRCHCRDRDRDRCHSRCRCRCHCRFHHHHHHHHHPRPRRRRRRRRAAKGPAR